MLKIHCKFCFTTTEQLPFNIFTLRIISEFSVETLKVKRDWTDVLQAQRDQRCQHRLLYPVKLSIPISRERKTFHSKNKFRQFLFTNAALQKALKAKIYFSLKRRIYPRDHEE